MIDQSKFNDKKEWRKFGIAIAIIFLVLATIQLFLHKSLSLYLYATSAFVLILSFVAPVALKPVFILFSYLGHVMGWFSTRLLLTVLFYLVMTPISMIAKIGRKKFLNLHFSSSQESYWMERSEISDRKEWYEKQY